MSLDSGTTALRLTSGEAIRKLQWSDNGRLLLVFTPHATRVYDPRGRVIAEDDPSDATLDIDAAFQPGTERVAVLRVPQSGTSGSSRPLLPAYRPEAVQRDGRVSPARLVAQRPLGTRDLADREPVDLRPRRPPQDRWRLAHLDPVRRPSTRCGLVLRILNASALALLMIVATACGATDPRAEHRPAQTEEFGFAATPGWHTSSTGFKTEAPQVPSVTASTIPIEDPPGALPTETLKRLPASGIVILVAAYTPWEGMNQFPQRVLPPQLGDADVREDWEGPAEHRCARVPDSKHDERLLPRGTRLLRSTAALRRAGFPCADRAGRASLASGTCRGNSP